MGKKDKERKRSLATEILGFSILLIFLQSLLLLGSMILGGVLTQSEDTVYQALQSKVTARAKFLQSEIDNRWSNINPYIHQMATRISREDAFTSSGASSQFLTDASNTLISMVRTTGTTGSFLILEDSDGDGGHTSLYFRNYDPATSSEDNKDLYLLAGPAELSKELRIPLDRTWTYEIKLEADNEAFFREPFAAAGLTKDVGKLAYWSEPFRLCDEDEEIITYSVPVTDQTGRVRGVMGVEVLTEYFKKLLPANELTAQDSLGYLVAEVNGDLTRLQAVISKGSYQKRVLGEKPYIDLKPLSEEHNIYELTEVNAARPVYGCIQEISLYRTNVPYEEKRLAVVGLMEQEELMSFVDLLQRILVLSFLASLLLGGGAAVIISRRLVAPVVRLAEAVRGFDSTKDLRLDKTGFSELDELAGAFEQSNRNLLETTLKMSKVMDLLNVPIAAYEYTDGAERVRVTNQLFELMDLPKEQGDVLFVDREVFQERMQEIQSHPEPDEQRIFRATNTKWLKIEKMDLEHSCLGVISDVSEEICSKYRIKQERDYDFLTRIYNRSAFQREAELYLEGAAKGVTAMVMFDLDNLKVINDTYGHEYGDIYIRTAAQYLARLSCGYTVVGRRSGDEFFAFFGGAPSRDAVRKAVCDFYQELETAGLRFPNGEPYQVKLSSGVSWYGVDAFDYEELLRHADFAMYEVKQSGKGRLGEFYPESVIQDCDKSH